MGRSSATDASTGDASRASERDTATPRIGWFFSLGHGHYAQFLNFRESWQEQESGPSEWVGLDGTKSGDRRASLPFLPSGLRYSLNEMWHARDGLRRHDDWGALFLATENARFLPFIRKYPSYLYTDFTPSLKAELAPWYESQRSKHAAVQLLKDELHAFRYRSCRGVFTMSRWAANGVMRDYRVPAERVHVTLPGANLRRFHFTDRSGRDPNARKRLLMVGGEFERKGGLELLHWAENTSRSDWELDIVTWPGQLPTWVREAIGNPAPSDAASGTLAPRLPHVRVHCGIRANAPELMSLLERADIFCLPTLADGSSIAGLEAMAKGLPVLVGAVGGIPELIEDGKTGYLVRPGDRAQWKQTLEGLLEDAALRLEIGKNARAACERHLNVDRQVREITSIIRRDQARTSKPRR